ncbi:MAG: ribosomal protein S18-alanine N-acetyltransferase [Chromatiales bacterium]|nr:ribosomal protein S18-alanine N-acetyltransferase [Chromatiales bacterium]
MSALLKDPLLKIRPMNRDDLDAVMAVESRAYPFPWTKGIFSDCLRVGYQSWVYTLDTQVIGFCVMSIAAGEAHILNICIAPEHQGKGLGRRLLNRMLGLAGKQSVDTVLLEVRASNQAAIQLYQSCGFNEVGVRRGYYPAGNGREDAIVLALAMC